VGDRRWNLRLENGVDVKLPEVGVEKALSDIVALDQTYKIFSRDIESVDLRLPDRVTVTLTSEAAAERSDALAAQVSAKSGDRLKTMNGTINPAKTGSAHAGGNT
jgi:cell division protein FtsQ